MNDGSYSKEKALTNFEDLSTLLLFGTYNVVKE